MKTILLPLESGDGQQAMLETAWLAATAFGSTIQGLYIRRALPGVVVADIGGYAAAAPDLVESFEAEDRERGASARRAFEEFLRGKGVALGEAPSGAGPAGAGQNALAGEPSITVGNIKEYQADNSIKSRFLPVRSVATIHGQAVLWADGAQDSGAIG